MRLSLPSPHGLRRGGASRIQSGLGEWMDTARQNLHSSTLHCPCYVALEQTFVCLFCSAGDGTEGLMYGRQVLHH